MHPSRPAAERVRPILQAMERSIDAARQRRLHDTDERPEELETTTPPAEPRPLTPHREQTPRLKARPKRAMPLRESPPIQSHAG